MTFPPRQTPAPARRRPVGTARRRRRAALSLGVPVLLAAVVTAGYPGWSTYTIRNGDTLESIAKRYGTTVSELVKANDLPGNGNLIYAGARLQVPGGSSSGGSSAATKHRVVAGDTLIGIARKYGVTTGAVARANDLRDRNRVRLGSVLTIPGAAARQASPRSSSSDATYSGNTFAGRTYSDAVVSSAARNRATLESRDVPSREGMRDLIASTARRHGVDPSLALAISWQESGWNMRRVSVANAIGAMQVIPASGDWASDIIGRELNLLDPEDNATAGVVLLEVLTRVTGDDRTAIAAYYQGLASVRRNGMFADTKQYVANIMALRERY
jgi:LysM repeat protein